MRHLMFLAMAAIAVLASCTKTEIIHTGQQQEIGFKMVESVMTKATEHTGDLGVFAYYNETSSHTKYFENVKFTKPDAVWTGGYYWPLSGTLDFVVYAPYAAGYTYNTTDHKLTKDNIIDANVDFLYGNQYYDNNAEAAGDGYSKTNVPVNVVLKHGKAQITVTVQTSDEATGKVKISNFNFTPFNTVGKPTVTYSATGELATTNPITWDLDDPATTLTFASEEKTLTSAVAYICNGVLVIPANDTRTLSFKYQFKIGDTDNWTTALSYSDDITTDIQAGKSYTFAITISPTEITIDANVDEWGDESNVPVSVPTA